MALLFRIKICGVTNESDARLAAASGADAVGLNFFPPSPRYLSLPAAQEIARALPAAICKVGVFVNADPDQMLRLADQVGLDLLQLHGDEPAETLRQLSGRRLLRAFRLGPAGTLPVLRYLRRCRDLGCLPEAILVDAFQPGAYGGTGRTADWNAVRELAAEVPELPLILAGGLTPDNVAAAIAAVRPTAVDTSSGVEASPGRKAPELVREFVRRAHAALARIADGS